ncbi:hypothetical protein [Prevotella nigrescens]
MELRVKDLVESIDLSKSEVMLPIYESIVNSIISLSKVKRNNKKIDIFIERKELEATPDLFGKNTSVIQNVTIVDNGEGFTTANYKSFGMPFSPINKKYGCKGIGRFTILAMFENVSVTSIYQEDGKYWKREFLFDKENEIHETKNTPIEGVCGPQTKVCLSNCCNEELIAATAKNADEIAKGIMEHCFIYYLCNNLPEINIVEISKDRQNDKSLSVQNYFAKEAKDKEKDITVYDKKFHLYIIKADKTTCRKYNYVTLCANSRSVGAKINLAVYDSLYTYPIVENGEPWFLDVFVVSDYLDDKINNSRTAFRIPEKNENQLDFKEQEHLISVEDIMTAITKEISSLYSTYAKNTKEKNIQEVKNYINNSAPQYRSFLYRQDILEAMPPNLTDEKKDEYLHNIAYKENSKISKKIEEFIKLQDVNEEKISEIITTVKKKTAYDSDSLADYVFRRKAIIDLFEKMLDAHEDGKYELESMIHNLIFPMGLTNRQITYQYHNLWLLDDRLSSFKYIASDKSITSFSQIKSSQEPDLLLINNEKDLVDNRISFGDKDSGEIGTMVIFEFKRPGDTAHQKKKSNYRWEFSELVEKYFDDFIYGKEKEKKNYRGNVVKVNNDTPKFGYIIMDEMPEQLIEFNKGKGWRTTPYHSYYKINADQNLHIEAIMFQDLLRNARDRNNPFFDHLFTSKI